MKLFNLHIITNKEYDRALDAHYSAGYHQSTFDTQDAIADIAKFNYNEGKAYGIEQAKKAFAEALKQKGESNNDILRPN